MGKADIRTAVREKYDQTAGEYDARWSKFIEASRVGTVRRLPDESPSRIVDVGCGTGSLLGSLLREYPDVEIQFGIDLSRAMLKKAAHKVSRTAGFAHASAQKLPIRTETMDWVISCNAFHFFPAPKLFLRESHRILKPGGRLIITDWCADFIACRLFDWYLRFTDPTHHRLFGHRELGDIVRSAGFESISIDRYKIDGLRGLMTLVATREDSSRNNREVANM